MTKCFHEALTIPLDKKENVIYALEKKFVSRRTWIDKAITAFFEEEMMKPKHCPNCGGVLPELAFEYKGKRFRFTCYRIEENDKVIVKTDYAKFAKYCGKIDRTKQSVDEIAEM